MFLGDFHLERVTHRQVPLHGHADCEVYGARLGYQANLSTQNQVVVEKEKKLTGKIIGVMKGNICS